MVRIDRHEMLFRSWLSAMKRECPPLGQIADASNQAYAPPGHLARDGEEGEQKLLEKDSRTLTYYPPEASHP